MARNTTGLRRGGPGRPKGSKDKVPRSFRKIAAAFCAAHADDIASAMAKALKVKGERTKLLSVLAALEPKEIDVKTPGPLFAVGTMPDVHPAQGH